MWLNSVLLITFTVVLEASKILVLFPIPNTSHFKLGEGISLALANAGHEVTMVSAYSYETNLTNLVSEVLNGAVESHDEEKKDHVMDDFQSFGIKDLRSITTRQEEQVRTDFSRSNMRHLLETGRFDLVVVEMFAQHALLGLGQHFGAPIIAVSPFPGSTWASDLVGNTSPPSYVPHGFSAYPSHMNLLKRIKNLLIYTVDKLFMQMYIYPGQRRVYNEIFPNARLTFDEALKNVSLVFENSHISIHGNRPFVPNMIEIGGIHLKPLEPLPSHIELFLETATDGVIYFSLGSIIKSSSSTMSAEKRDIFCKVFASNKQKVIWKFEDDIPNLPPNVMTSKWLPQNAILAHPNVKLFISHCGAFGTHEAINYGVPIMGMPFFGDQRRNIEAYAQSGWALLLEYTNVTENSLRWALSTLLDDKSFYDTAKRISAVYRDRPMTPSQSVVYWSEHVIRHKGAHHFRSAALDLNFIQYHNLDVIGICVFAALIFTVLGVFLVKWFLHKCIIKTTIQNSKRIKKD